MLQFQSEKQAQIKAIQTGSREAAVYALANFDGIVVCNFLASNIKNYVKKNLVYSWVWDYAPTNTYTDKMAFAWNGEFDSMPETIQWAYVMEGKSIGGNYDMYEQVGRGYDQYEVNINGIGKDLDIKAWFQYSGQPKYWVTSHAGQLTSDISMFYYGSENKQFRANGNFFHQNLPANWSLNFDLAPVISMSWAAPYTKSPDRACL